MSQHVNATMLPVSWSLSNYLDYNDESLQDDHSGLSAIHSIYYTPDYIQFIIKNLCSPILCSKGGLKQEMSDPNNKYERGWTQPEPITTKNASELADPNNKLYLYIVADLLWSSRNLYNALVFYLYEDNYYCGTVITELDRVVHNINLITDIGLIKLLRNHVGKYALPT